MLAAAASVKLSTAGTATAPKMALFKPLHLPPLFAAAAAAAGPRPLSLSARPLYRQQDPLFLASRVASPRAAAVRHRRRRPAGGGCTGGRGAGGGGEAGQDRVYFATWWALNVIFNIYNKKVLNAFPYPWLTSTLSLAAGSAIMLASWATRIAEAPATDLDFWKALSPVRSH